MSASIARPGGVTLVAVLTYIQGALDIIGGVTLLFSQNVPEVRVAFGGEAGVIAAGVIYILLGVIIFIVAAGLLRGSRGARMVVTIVMLLNLAGSVFLMIAAPAQFISALVGGLVALFILLLLWSGRAAAFFRS